MREPAQDSWPPGTVIVQEEYWLSQLVTVRPVTVVEDSGTLLALFSHAGGRCLSGAMVGRQQMSIDERLRVYLSKEQPMLVERAVRANVLTLNQPGAAHSISLFWDATWSQIGWYVNLQALLQRTPRGIVVKDYLLDLTVTPDLIWRWKDEDEFEAVCAAGVFSPEQQHAIRAEGLRVAARVEAREWPFSSAWPRWRPDPAWTVPGLSHRS
jgi:predicted RNA-binding protein associated with RNAse of E/G family